MTRKTVWPVPAIPCSLPKATPRPPACMKPPDFPSWWRSTPPTWKPWPGPSIGKTRNVLWSSWRQRPPPEGEHRPDQGGKSGQGRERHRESRRNSAPRKRPGASRTSMICTPCGALRKCRNRSGPCWKWPGGRFRRKTAPHVSGNVPPPWA